MQHLSLIHISFACTDDQHLQQKLHLIAQAYAAHGILTVPVSYTHLDVYKRQT